MEQIYRYIEEHATQPSEALKWVEKQTHIRTNHARMLSGALQGQLMRMMVQMSGARRILELGTFTGYSAICLASGLPEDGHLDTLELNDELEDLILEGFERAGLDDKIALHIGDCKQTLCRFREEMGLAEGSEADKEKLYDIVYIDFPLLSVFLFLSEDIPMTCRSAEGWFCRSVCRYPYQWGVCSRLYRFRKLTFFHNLAAPGRTLSSSSLQMGHYFYLSAVQPPILQKISCSYSN